MIDINFCKKVLCLPVHNHVLQLTIEILAFVSCAGAKLQRTMDGADIEIAGFIPQSDSGSERGLQRL